MSEWKNEKLVTFCQVITKGTTPTSLGKNFTAQGINFIKAESITESGVFIKENIAHIDESTHQLLRRSALQKDDILFSIAGVIGRVAIVDEEITPANTNQALAIIRLTNESAISVTYLKYYLKSDHVLSQFKRISNQLAQANFNLGDLGNLDICVPPLPIQRKIALILSTIDGQIEKTEAIIAKYQAVKQGMLQDLFTRGIDVRTGQLRPRYEDAPELYQESALGLIPKDWEVKRLGQVSSINRGKFAHRPRNEPKFYNGNYPFIQTGDITRCTTLFLTEATQTLNERGIQISRKFPKNTIVITIAANIGDTAILGVDMYLTDSVIGVEVYENHNHRFIQLTLNNLKDYLNNVAASQSAQKNINIQTLMPLLIPIPRIDEQNCIALMYEQNQKLIENYESILAKLQSLKQGVMKDLLSGKVEVTA